MSEPELQPVVKRREQNFKLGIIGHGFLIRLWMRVDGSHMWMRRLGVVTMIRWQQ